VPAPSVLISPPHPQTGSEKVARSGMPGHPISQRGPIPAWKVCLFHRTAFLIVPTTPGQSCTDSVDWPLAGIHTSPPL
ncbi:hypothetical protein E2320_000181, partial [Naja naja]